MTVFDQLFFLRLKALYTTHTTNTEGVALVSITGKTRLPWEQTDIADKRRYERHTEGDDRLPRCSVTTSDATEPSTVNVRY